MRRLWYLAALAASAARGAEEAPAWLKQASQATHPQYESKAPAVVLLDEESLTFDATGKSVRTRRYAVKVLTLAGKGEARVGVPYLLRTDKIRSVDAWTISPSGQVQRYGKKESVDRALVDFELYSEYRYRSIDGSMEAKPGSVFGYEAVIDEKPLTAQDRFVFQGRLPVLCARYVLTLPSGWEHKSVTFNHAPIQPSVQGTTATWELRDLPFIEEEDDAPGLNAITPRLHVTYFGGPAEAGKSFKDWPEVSQWLGEFERTQAVMTPELTAKAKELTAAAKTDTEKIEAIAEFVQKIRYVAIATDLGRGGGYKPFPAAEVLAKSYGDCKDKANLMRTLLKAVNLESWMVSIHSGDRTFVRSEYPSPQQFNHAILAVKAPEGSSYPATYNHPKLGRLVIFDPTDSNTPFGLLPDHEQDSWALLDSVAETPLFRAPAVPPSANRVVRKVEAELTEGGEMKAQVLDESHGDQASRARGLKKDLSPDDYRRVHERFVNRVSSSAALKDLQSKDAGKSFETSWTIECARCSQMMQNRLLTFKPVVLRFGGLPDVTKTKRIHPVVLDSQALEETVRVKLPAGFKIDELPDDITLETPYGKVKASWRQDSDAVLFERKLEIPAKVVPAEEYPALRKFIGAAQGVEAAPVVLLRGR